MNENTTSQTDLLTRDGHLAELTVNRLLAGELGAAERRFVDAHTADCATCHARLEAVCAADAAFAIEPPPAQMPRAGNVVSLDTARARRGPLYALLAVAAAAVCVVVARSYTPARVAPGGDEDVVRFKGSDLDLEVYAKTDSDPPRPVGDGDLVHPGDRLGFRVTSRADGYLMILGIDDRGDVYPVWPQGAQVAEFARSGDEPRELDAAVRLDDAGGRERLVLLRCAQPFDIGAAEQQIVRTAADLNARADADPMRDCRYDDVELRKAAR